MAFCFLVCLILVQRQICEVQLMVKIVTIIIVIPTKSFQLGKTKDRHKEVQSGVFSGKILGLCFIVEY